MADNARRGAGVPPNPTSSFVDDALLHLSEPELPNDSPRERKPNTLHNLLSDAKSILANDLSTVSTSISHIQNDFSHLTNKPPRKRLGIFSRVKTTRVPKQAYGSLQQELEKVASSVSEGWVNSVLRRVEAMQEELIEKWEAEQRTRESVYQRRIEEVTRDRDERAEAQVAAESIIETLRENARTYLTEKEETQKQLAKEKKGKEELLEKVTNMERERDDFVKAQETGTAVIEALREDVHREITEREKVAEQLSTEKMFKAVLQERVSCMARERDELIKAQGIAETAIDALYVNLRAETAKWEDLEEQLHKEKTERSEVEARMTERIGDLEAQVDAERKAAGKLHAECSMVHEDLSKVQRELKDEKCRVDGLIEQVVQSRTAMKKLEDDLTKSFVERRKERKDGDKRLAEEAARASEMKVRSDREGEEVFKMLEVLKSKMRADKGEAERRVAEEVARRIILEREIAVYKENEARRKDIESGREKETHLAMGWELPGLGKRNQERTDRSGSYTSRCVVPSQRTA